MMPGSKTVPMSWFDLFKNLLGSSHFTSVSELCYKKTFTYKSLMFLSTFLKTGYEKNRFGSHLLR